MNNSTAEPFTIKINTERTLVAAGEPNLFTCLAGNNIFLPSACGGKGQCGYCRVKVMNDAGPFTEPELKLVSETDRAKGIRLACQLVIDRNLEIELPDRLLGIKKITGSVTGLRDLTYDIKELRISLPEGQNLKFKPGQYVQIVAPPYELSDKPVSRAYSIASSPATNGEIELEIRFVPNGLCTTYIHKYLKIGDRIEFNGPHGDFFLREGTADIVFIGGGSGMAPIKSILTSMANSGSMRKATYFFGARSVRDLFLVEEMRNLEQKMPNFAFVPALSSPSADDAWKGETGLITEVVDRRLGNLADAEAYLCGSPGMINACIDLLTRKGLPVSKIFYDKFV